MGRGGGGMLRLRSGKIWLENSCKTIPPRLELGLTQGPKKGKNIQKNDKKPKKYKIIQ